MPFVRYAAIPTEGGALAHQIGQGATNKKLGNAACRACPKYGVRLKEKLQIRNNFIYLPNGKNTSLK